MRFLGIDYGTKRIGVAISDENGRLAFPKEIVLNTPEALKKIGEILKKEKVSEIVVGESVDFSGKLNILSAQIDFFIEDLEKMFHLPVNKQKEFLTSVEARRYQNLGGQARKSKNSKADFNQKQAHSKLKQKKSGHIDSSAAALILQRYLDKINKTHST